MGLVGELRSCSYLQKTQYLIDWVNKDLSKVSHSRAGPSRQLTYLPIYHSPLCSKRVDWY